MPSTVLICHERVVTLPEKHPPTNGTLVSSWALAKLSTAMAKNTFRRVSADARVRESNAAGTLGIGVSRSPPSRPHPGVSPRAPVVDTVPEECQHDEVDGEHHATLHAALRFDAIVHDLVPVLACQDLKGREEHTANPPLRHGPLGEQLWGPNLPVPAVKVSQPSF